MLNHLDNFFKAQIFEPQKGMLKFMEYFVPNGNLRRAIVSDIK